MLLGAVGGRGAGLKVTGEVRDRHILMNRREGKAVFVLMKAARGEGAAAGPA